jgi:hypothetical protein
VAVEIATPKAPISVVEPRHRTVADASGRRVDDRRREIAVDEDVDLDRRRADDCRAHERHDLADARFVEVEHRPVAEPDASETRPLNGKLEKAAAQRAVRHAFDRAEADMRPEHKTQKKSSDNRADVEKRRCQGGHTEAVQRV